MSTTAISTNDLSIGFHSRKQAKTLAKGINLQLQNGQLTCLIGSNGIGKSTLLRTLAGLQSPIKGEISILDENLTKISPADRAKLVSIVLPGSSHFGDLTVTQLVQLGRLPYSNWLGQLSEKDHRAVEKALTLVGMERLAQRSVVTLSDGERQKVLVARALAQETNIIILDEPTAFLDWNNRVSVLMVLKKLAHSAGLAILLSSHDLELVLQIADSLWVMDSDGSMACGKPDEILHSGVLERVFSTPYGSFNPERRLFQGNLK